MAEKYRNIESYLVTLAPFIDARTGITLPEAVYTLGAFNLDIIAKTIYWSVAVWASVDAFESGAEPIGLVKEYQLTAATGLTFDAVLERFKDMKSGVGVALQTLSEELDAGAHNKVETVPDADQEN